jgi:hypothetical protein
MLNRIAAGDEIREIANKPVSKRASMQWKHPTPPTTRKFKVTPSDGKVMLTVF